MKAPKLCYFIMVLCIAASCKKETQPLENQTLAVAAGATQSSQAAIQTTHGLLVCTGGFDVTRQKLDYAGINLARVSLILSQKTKSDVIDKYLRDGYNVQVNLNWANVSKGPEPFPTNITNIKKRAEAFFEYYAPQKAKIPVVVVENEWDNISYHKGSIDHYLDELAAITEIGHKYGFKIADAGLSSTSLRRWTYSKLSGEAASLWYQQYWVGYKLSNFKVLVKTVDHYAEAVSKIPIDYLNIHWYNLTDCFEGFDVCAKEYKTACQKTKLICNEFGIKTNAEQLFNATVNELDGKVFYAIAYSGAGPGDGKSAVPLTNPMLSMLGE